MHLDEQQVQRLLHRELSAAAETAARGHLTECAGCRERVAEAKRDEDALHALLGSVDHAPPRVSAEAIAVRARARARGGVRWAAGVVLLLGVAGAAYAAPGSPVPGWVKAVVQLVRRPPSAPPAEPVPAEAPAPAVAGIAVTPGRSLIIVFTVAQAGGEAVVSLTDSDAVTVRAPMGVATFTSEVNRLVIDNQGTPATFEIRIPRAAPRLEILAGGRRIFLKEGPRITTDPPSGAGEIYQLPLGASAP